MIPSSSTARPTKLGSSCSVWNLRAEHHPISSSDMSFSSTTNQDYGRKDYWDVRYEKDEEFEWCKDYSILKPLLSEHLLPQHSILMLGCGNSQLSSDLYNGGFENITNIDFSEVVVSKMSEKFPQMKWLAMDMLDLRFPNESFDVVIEKATLDVLFVDEKSPWTPSQAVSDKMEKVLSGVQKILKKQSGKFLSITFTQPHFRKPFYEKYWTDCRHKTFGNGFHYYFYASMNSQ